MSDGDGNEGLGAGEGCDAEPRSAPERLEWLEKSYPHVHGYEWVLPMLMQHEHTSG
jgi:hypothetical protein